MKRSSGLLAACLMASVTLSGAAGCSGGSKSKVRPVMSMSDAEARRLQVEPGNSFDTGKGSKFTPETRFAAGQLAESQKAPTRAIEQYKEALKLNPQHVDSLYRLGVVYTELRKYPDAIEAWKQYAKVTRSSAAALSNLGFCYELAGQPELAEKTYQEGIQKDSNNAPCRVNYGLMLARNGRTNDAMQQLQMVLSPAQVHYNLGSIHETAGRREQAKLEYRKAIELDADMADAQVRLDAME